MKSYRGPQGPLPFPNALAPALLLVLYGGTGQVRLLNSLTLRATRATMNAKSKRKNNKSDATGPKNGTRRKRFMRLLMLLRRSATGGAIWW